MICTWRTFDTLSFACQEGFVIDDRHVGKFSMYQHLISVIGKKVRQRVPEGTRQEVELGQ